MPSIDAYLQNSSDVNLRSYQHASRLYVDNYYALAPKPGWIYYTTFDVNTDAIQDTSWLTSTRIMEAGMLVKKVDLPKFNIETETLNQYNKKTIIQKKITYNTVSLSFHDDNSNIVKSLWSNYMRYYYNDSNLRGTGSSLADYLNVSNFQLDKYSPPNGSINPTDFGYNTGNVDKAFFNSIAIYQLSRQQFSVAVLVNPKIREWSHHTMDQTQGNVMCENHMTVDYEAVFYSHGTVTDENPGFYELHYDTTPSPLTVMGSSSITSDDLFGSSGGNGSNGSSISSSFGLSVNNTGVTVNGALNVSANSTVGNSNLGFNLNLGSSNGNVTVGTSISTIASIDASNNVTITDSVTAGLSFSAANNGNSATSNYSEQSTLLSSESFTAPTDDVTPSGSTVSSGSYFTTPTPLSNTNAYTASSSIDSQSSVSDIENAITQLEINWASDNDYVASQQVSQDDINSALSNASSPQEYSAIQTEAITDANMITSMQNTVNSKYQTEYTRLNTLLSNAQNNVTGPSSLQTTQDPNPSNTDEYSQYNQ